jgi:hypothetical protein
VRQREEVQEVLRKRFIEYMIRELARSPSLSSCTIPDIPCSANIK